MWGLLILLCICSCCTCFLTLSVIHQHKQPAKSPNSVFINQLRRFGPRTKTSLSTGSMSEEEIDPAISEKFRILTCSATTCAKRRKVLNMDQFATFSALYTRIKEGEFPNIQIEETSCLGMCKQGPVVGIEHEDFDGRVSLDGMSDQEFQARACNFAVSTTRVITESDADRIYDCVDNAIRTMAEEDDDDNDEEY